jgi:hypothetical protein
MEHATPPESCTAPVQIEVQTRTPERVSTEVPEIAHQAGVQNLLGADLEVGGANQSEANQPLGVPERSRVNPEATTPEAASDRNISNTEANTSELRPNESEAIPNMEAAPLVGPCSSSRFTGAFEVLVEAFLVIR